MIFHEMFSTFPKDIAHFFKVVNHIFGFKNDIDK